MTKTSSVDDGLFTTRIARFIVETDARALPAEVIEKTGAKYREALERLTGLALKD